jgi:FkbM family methyltransferase
LRFGVAPSIEHVGPLEDLSPDAVIDVGANRGQFALLARLLYGPIRIVSFEPIPAEADVFESVHGGNPTIRLHRCALGAAAGQETLHLSESADSSSLLPIGRKQTELFEHTQEIGTLTVPVRRLDDHVSDWVGASRQLLKIDVQGFELNVLRGAASTLGTCAYVYVECSEVSLYDGQALRQEVDEFLAAHGFVLISRHNLYWEGDQLIQSDCLFGRRS